jgi:hypothetical protein
VRWRAKKLKSEDGLSAPRAFRYPDRCQPNIRSESLFTINTSLSADQTEASVNLPSNEGGAVEDVG